MGNEVSVWNKIMSVAISLPGVKVDREKFLSEELKPYCSDETKLNIAISQRPIKVVPEYILDKIAKACINNHTTKVTCLSVVAGIPGGLTMTATIPADMAQYYWHVFVLSQKLSYLYGFPDLCDENGKLSETAQDMLTLLVGIMMGASAASQGIKYVSEQLAKQTVKKLPQIALTKTFYYPIIKQVAKWIGVKLTKDTFAKGLGKVIPILGGVLSGALTLTSFKPGATRLRNNLQEQMHLIESNDGHCDFTDSENVNTQDVNTDDTNFDFNKYMILILINMAKIDFNLATEEIDYITQIIDDSALDEDEKMELISTIHSKELSKVDLSAFKNNMQYSILLMTNLAKVAKADNVIKPEEKIYFFKIGKDLGFTHDEIVDMLN